MNYLPDDPGKCLECEKQIPYATGAGFLHPKTKKIICRQCCKKYLVELPDGWTREVGLADLESTAYVEPYNFAK